MQALYITSFVPVNYVDRFVLLGASAKLTLRLPD